MKYLLFLFFIVFSSCGLFKEFKKREFKYGLAAENFKLIVPKGWRGEEVQLDSAGYKEQYFYYRGNTTLYFVRAADTAKYYQVFDTSTNIPLVHPSGGLIYKGVDANGLYWREIRILDFRFGYRNVPTQTETRFDSALNYAALMKKR